MLARIYGKHRVIGWYWRSWRTTLGLFLPLALLSLALPGMFRAAGVSSQDIEILIRFGLLMTGFAWMYWRAYGICRRSVVRTLSHTDDIASICTHCLHTSDAMREGRRCPECGKTHPDRFVKRWETTARALSMRTQVRAALDRSTTLPSETVREEAGREETA